MVRELALRLRTDSAQIEVACLSAWGPVADVLQQAGVSVHALNARGAGDLNVFKRLAELIRSQQYDTVLSFLVHANVAAAIASQMVDDVRFIQSIQTTQPKPRWHWKAQAIAAKAAEVVVVPSPSVAEVAQSWSWIDRSKIVVIPNAIDPADYPCSRTLRMDDIHIGFLGRLDPIKRVPLLVEALSKLESNFRLDLFGEGEDRPRIEAATRKHLVTDRVTLHGAVGRPQAALEQMDLLVLPSQAEGFGLVLIEAMAAGVPIVVGEDIPGIRDVVRCGATALCAKVEWPTALAIAIWGLFNDQSLRHRLIENARREVRERFSWDVVLPQYRKLLRI